MSTSSTLSFPNTLTNGNDADATEVMADFNAVATLINTTGIGTNNIKDDTVTVAKMDSAASALLVPTGGAAGEVLIKSSGSDGDTEWKDRSTVALHLDTGNGHGSTNDKIRRFTSSRENTLSGYATYADSASNGMSVTIAAGGVGLWAIEYADQSAAVQSHGISLNSNALTTSIVGLTYAQGKRAEAACSAGGAAMAVITLRLAENDVIRAHTNGSVDGTGNRVIFRMTYLGK